MTNLRVNSAKIMNAFSTWFGTGFEHIIDLAALDHLLFVTLLATTYPPERWKNLLLLVTAFTGGHAITLLICMFPAADLPVNPVEAGIALSILATGIYNTVTWSKPQPGNVLIFCITCIFGLLHGLGFSFAIRSMLQNAHEVILPLLYFNLGVEAGQLLVAAAVLLISLFLTAILKIPFKYLKLVSACLISLFALTICIYRLQDAFSF